MYKAQLASHRRTSLAFALGVLCLTSFSTSYAQALSYNIAVTGPSSAYAGQTVYFMLKPATANSSTVKLTFNSVTLANTPLQFAVNCNIDDCRTDTTGHYVITIYTQAPSQGILRVQIPQAVPAGQYSLQVNTDLSGTPKTTSIPLRVMAPATPLLNALSLSAGPVPNITQWETFMVKYGKKWCDPKADYGNFGLESLVWVYDGARVFFQVADYTKDPSWNACALNIARQYRDYVMRLNGGIALWRVYTTGLRMAYERTGDPSFKTAINVLVQASNGFIRWQTSVDDDRIRETAYALEAVIDAEKAGEPRNPNLYRLADYLIGHFDRLFIAKNYTIHQTFFDGLGAEALISYYELTHDPRIPPVIRTMLDWMYDVGWDKSKKKLIYNPEPLGPKCDNLCRSYFTNLNNLIVPAFAWYWHVTGDSLYLQRGDELFGHALDEDISYNGKIYSQNYRWSFDYVKWRPGACAYGLTVPSSAVPSAGGVVTATVVTQPSCSWTLQSGSTWASAEGDAHTGNGGVSVTVEPNPTTAVRTASLKVGETTVSLKQAAGSLGLSEVILSPATLPSGTTSTTNSVVLNASAATATTVLLTSSNPAVVSVPASVVVPARATSAAFTVTTMQVTKATNVTITASAGDVSRTAVLSVQAPEPSTSAALASFWLYPANINGGDTTTNNRVTLAQPAGANGVVVNLVSNAPATASVPAQVIVSPGQTYAVFSVATKSVTAIAAATITASVGTSTRSAILTLNPVEMTRVELWPREVMGGKPASGSRIVFDGPMPPNAVIALKSSNPSVAAVPSSVSGAAGGVYSAHFEIATKPVSVLTPVTISATYRGATVSAVLTLKPAQLIRVSLQHATVAGGATVSNNYVMLDGPAPAPGATVMLKSSSAAVSVPASVTVPSNETLITFPATTKAVTSSQTATITATYGGVTTTTTINITP